MSNFSTLYPKQLQFQAADASVAVAGLTTAATIPVEGLEQIGIEILNDAGGSDLDALNVDFLFHPDATDWYTVATAGADYTTPVWPVLKASADPTGLTAGSSVGIVLDVRAAYQVRIQASSALNPTTLTVQGCGR